MNPSTNKSSNINDEKFNNIAFKALFETAAEGILITNKDGIIVLCNPKVDQMFGYQKDELIGQKLEILIPQEYKHSHVHHRDNFYKKPSSRPMGLGKDFPAKRKDGTVFPVEISINSMQLDEERLSVAFVTDISGRKKVEQQVLKSRELLSYFVHHTPASVAMLDKELKYILVSSKWATEYGLKEKEIIGLKHESIFPDYQAHWSHLYEKCLSGEVIDIGEESILRPNGDTKWLKWEAHPWKDEHGETGGIIIFTEDITERKIASETLQKKEKELKLYTQQLERSNRELEDFAYISSHDLQEPLRKIRTFGDRLNHKERDNLSPKGIDYIERMMGSATRMQTLINDLLAFSRVTSKARPFTSVDLNKIVEEVLSDLEVAIETKNAKVRINPLPTIPADATQMRQLFQNLISNALKFSKEEISPEITISSEINDKEKKVYIKFVDNGIGFNNQYKERIFQIFQRLEGRKYEGSGIGLAICQKIANRHGGDISADSIQGEGTTFTVTLSTDHSN
ncbi:PAS domain S-box protein [Algivirga pacifica]|uniref:histidine kinase n=1 Tax=Algivirga pacifica TaxID=1162670 RepID=A0ABP9D640_9BACT